MRRCVRNVNSVTVMTVVRAIVTTVARVATVKICGPRRERRDVGDMQLYRIEVGRDDGVEVRHIVGAIANEGDISSRYIGNIKLFASHSTIELPKGMPGEVLQHFTRTRILNKPMNMQLLGDAQPHTGGERRGGGRGFGGERREGGRTQR